MPRTDTPSRAPGALLVAGGAVAGCALTALGVFLGGSDTAPAADPSVARLVPVVERVDTQVGRLTDQQLDLAGRITDLELAVLAGRSAREEQPLTALDATPETLEEMRATLADVTSALEQSSGEAARGPLVDQVVAALNRIEEQEEAEREAERAERREERLDRQLEDLTEALGLDANQQVSMKDLLADAGARRRDMDELPRDERRDARDALRTEVDTKLAGFLSPAQLQTLDDQGGLRLGGRGGDRWEDMRARFGDR